MVARVMDEPEWVGVAIRWPDGTIHAYEFRGDMTATIEYHRASPNHPFRQTFKVDAAHAREWEQGANAAPQKSHQQASIEPPQKAIEP